MKYSYDALISAHRYCRNNLRGISESELCGCFCCLRTYPASEVVDFIDKGGNTAMCPYCGVDSVLADASLLVGINRKFLQAMHELWFQKSEIVGLPR